MEKGRSIKREGTPTGKEGPREKRTHEDDKKRKDGNEIQPVPVCASHQPVSHPIYPQMPMPNSHYAYAYPESYTDPNQVNYNMVQQYNMYPGWAMNNGVMPAPQNVNQVNVMDPNVGMNMHAGSHFQFPMMADPAMFIPNPTYVSAPMGESGIPFTYINRERITFGNMSLSPPRPTDNAPTVNKKPYGCKTVYVGGLPEGTTEDNVREIFGRWGEVETIRMSDKNFCHIRFSDTVYTDILLQLSGFRLKLDSNDPKDGSRLHVDYAFARNDQHEFNCIERMKERERRHRMQAEREDNSPPPVPPFSAAEMENVTQNLKKEETFRQAIHFLTTWLEKGDCNKNSAHSFFSLIQSTNSQVRKMQEEKNQFEQQVETAKDNLLDKTKRMALNLEEILKVFEWALRQRVWDHFSKSQRKQIEFWKCEIITQKVALSDELIAKRNEEEMDLEDDTDEMGESSDIVPQPDVKDYDKLQKDYEQMCSQLSNMQIEVQEFKDKYQSKVAEVESLKMSLEEVSKKQLTPNFRGAIEADSYSEVSHQDPVSSTGAIFITEQETLLISLVATFLNVHPFGASIDYICSFLEQMLPAICARDVETLLKRCPNVFKEESTGIGASLEKKWLFIGFRI